MPNQKPRIMNDYKDLFLSLIPLVLIAVVFAGLASQCSFAATGPTEGRIPHFDIDAALGSDARSLDFPIRKPELPASWTPNSGSRETVTAAGGGPVSTVGYITGEGTYMRLSQSSATEQQLSRFVLGSRYPTGTVDVGGAKWAVYSQPTQETAWVTDLGGVRVLITGAGNDAAFRTLAGAVATAQPLES